MMSVAVQTRKWMVAMRLAFVAGDLDHALEIVRQASAELSAVEILDELVAPAMKEVGTLWESDMLSVADEHLATATAHWLLAQLSPLLKEDQATPRFRMAVLATTPSERHATGLLVTESVLRRLGFGVINLRGGVPLDALGAMLAREQPAVVGVSLTLSAWAAELEPTIATIRSSAPHARILLGGSGLPPARPGDFGVERVDGMRHLEALLAS
ncbi:MAG: B12-binding domain-containing protein [Solirubrobacterales bacterium]|nr:B12-binding domain-containing protein [Solirubrobacterales bacterium]